MKEFKIPTAKEIEARKKFRAKRLKVSDTSTIDCSIGGAVVASGLVELSLKMTLSRKRARVEEGDDLMLWIPHSTSSYSDAIFLESVGPSL